MATEYRQHFNEILQGAFVTFSLKIAGGVLNFLFFALLARFLDAGAVGVFFLSLSIIMFLTIAGTLGLPLSALRFVSASASAGRLDEVAGLHRLGVRNIVLASLVLSIVLLMGAGWLNDAMFHEPTMPATIRAMALCIIPASLLMYYTELFRALKRIAASTIVQSTGLHLVNVLLLVAGYFLFTLDEVFVGGFYSLAAILVCISASLYWRGIRKKDDIPYTGVFDHALLMRTSRPLLWVLFLTQALYWIDTLVLGIFRDAEVVGHYSAAMRVVVLILLLETAVNSLASPKFSSLHAEGDLDVLGMVVRRTTAFLILVGGCVLFSFLIGAEWILSIFGEEYVEAAPALRILSVGIFLSVAASAASQILMMTGNERVMRRNMIIAASVSIVLNFALVPGFGIIGAAIGGASGFALRNLLSVISIRRLLGIRMLPRRIPL